MFDIRYSKCLLIPAIFFKAESLNKDIWGRTLGDNASHPKIKSSFIISLRTSFILANEQGNGRASPSWQTIPATCSQRFKAGLYVGPTYMGGEPFYIENSKRLSQGLMARQLKLSTPAPRPRSSSSPFYSHPSRVLFFICVMLCARCQSVLVFLRDQGTVQSDGTTDGSINIFFVFHKSP